MSKILFEKMGIKPPKKTLTGFSTSADVLETLQESSPIVKKILNTGRWKNSAPPMSILCPIKFFLRHTGSIARSINRSLRPEDYRAQIPTCKIFPCAARRGKKFGRRLNPSIPIPAFSAPIIPKLSCGFWRIFPRTPILLKAFNEGEDIHAFTASLIFRCALKQVTPEMRFKAKAVNFGILYGQQAFGLSQAIGIEYKEAAAFIDAYFHRYKKVKEFLEFCKESVRKRQGGHNHRRQRPIPEIDSKNGMLRAAAERLAINTPLQGTNADIIKMAMISIDSPLKGRRKCSCKFTMSCFFEVADSQFHRVSKMVKHEMENVVSFESAARCGHFYWKKLGRMLALKKIAVTGGLASGKSTVCALLKKRGAYVVSADEIVHRLLSPHTPLGRQVIKVLGSDIVSGNELDRKKIAQTCVFRPSKARGARKASPPPSVK